MSHNMDHLRTQFGLFAEYYAAQYLKSKGYEIIGHNFKKPWGEIDIIAQKEGILIFVEVKANKKDLPGFEPELRVNSDKKYRMRRIAETYLVSYKDPNNQSWQMDVVSVTLDKDRGVAKFRHYKNIE